MRKATVEAIYERGILRLLEPLEGFPERCKVRVTVEAVEPHPLSDCVGIMSNEDAEEMRRIVEEEFERKDQNSGEKAWLGLFRRQ